MDPKHVQNAVKQDKHVYNYLFFYIYICIFIKYLIKKIKKGN